MPRTLSTALPACVAILVMGASTVRAQVGKGAPTPALPAQVYCPVTTDETIDPDIFTDYKGSRVYFCCDRCKVKFTKDPGPYLAQLTAFQAPADPSKAAQHGDAPHEHGSGDGTMSHPSAESAKEPEHHHDDDAAAHDEHAQTPMLAGHDHKEHGPGSGPRWQKWLGGFHPAMVNFPIGVLTAGALAEALFVLRRRPEFDHAARFCVVFAVVTGLAAGALGWLFGGLRLTDTNNLLAVHRWLGTGTVIWLLALLWASERARRPEHPSRSLYRFFLFGGAVLVSATGFLGGAMVYGLNHYLW